MCTMQIKRQSKQDAEAASIASAHCYESCNGRTTRMNSDMNCNNVHTAYRNVRRTQYVALQAFNSDPHEPRTAVDVEASDMFRKPDPVDVVGNNPAGAICAVQS